MPTQTTQTLIKNLVFLAVAFLLVIDITGAANSSSSNNQTGNQTPSPIIQGYTLAEVAKHNNANDCWAAINGSVYNITPFIPSHPGGDRILAVCGIDGTAAFEDQHGGQRRPANELATLKIGVLIQ